MKVKVDIDPNDFDDIFNDLFGTPSEPQPETQEKVNMGIPVLACGHRDWYTQEEHDYAQQQGFCCQGGQRKQARLWDRTSGDVPIRLQYDAKRKGYKGYVPNSTKGVLIGQ